MNPLVDEVVYPTKRRNTKAEPKKVVEPKTVPRKVVEPKAVPTQLTDKDGLDSAYGGEHDISIIDNTLHIPGTKVGRASDWYDDITKVPTLWNAVPIVNQCKSFMFGMNALLYVGVVARKVDTVAPYASMALKTVPRLAPEYGEAAMQLEESLGSDTLGLQAVPDVANTASSIDQKSRQGFPMWEIR